MKILSIYLGHNSTIAFSKDGEMKYVLHEEKFDNVKNSDNFPLRSLQYLKEKENISDLDKIVVVGRGINWWMLRYIENYSKKDKTKIVNYRVNLYDKVLYFFMKYLPWFMNFVNDAYIELRQYKFKDSVIELIERGLGEKNLKTKVIFTSHHECHALSVIHFYGLQNSPDPILIFTLDGGGDRHCATFRIWNKGQLKTISTVRNWYSIGDIWSKSFTGGMGMTPLEHEYKVMGLAAYSSKQYFKDVYNKLFKNTIKIDGLTWKSKIPGNKSHVYYHDKLWGLRFDNIAGALQEFTEEIIIQLIENGVKQTGIKKLAVSGGVFMNVKLNQKIQELDYLEKIYFMPSGGDESTPIGGVLSGYANLGFDLNKIKPIKSMFLGNKYSNDEVGKFLKSYENKYIIEKFEKNEDLTERIANLLSNHEIVGIFQGACEFGARSLCNRAILANASDLRNFHTVNDMIKMRDFWMPFAPTILEEWADKYILNWNNFKDRVLNSSYYMITAFDSTELAQNDLRAAIHQKDKTLRPQLVNKESNPIMYDILKKYEKLTGMGGVMNTSLNIHGYPLVGTLEQAIFTLENSGLNHIALNNYLLSKK